MASEEVPVVAPGKNGDASVSPEIGVFVTADVRVVQYRSSGSLGNCDSKKCTIVTSLTAIINKSSNRSLGSKECIADTIKTAEISKEVGDHPIVRRSKKNTKLNGVNNTEFTASRKGQIDRTVILPFLGCTRRFEPFPSYNAHVLAKRSKSWETVGKSNKCTKTLKPFRSQTFNNNGSINITSSKIKVLDYEDIDANQPLCFCLGEYEQPNTGFNTSKKDVRSFYLIKTPISGNKTFSNRTDTVENAYNSAGKQNYSSAIPSASNRKKSEIHKNMTVTDGKDFAPQAKLNLKTTRNVSILHRPKTRDKSTSTTSLDGLNVSQDLSKSVQGLLPYVAIGRDFPSEVVLKLVPKAQALKSQLNENNKQASRSQNSSEVNLLAPTLNGISKTQNKKEKYKGIASIWSYCFSRKKNTTDNSASNSTLASVEKEIYYPSIVEVHNKNKKCNNQSNSEMVVDTDSSFYHVNKKNKR